MQNVPHATRERSIKRAGYVFGILLVLAGLALVLIPQSSRFAAKGPANTGHDKLACTDCHKEAPGTLRQQLQAKAYYLLGLRETNPTFGHERVSNDACTDCHARGQDAHPTHRFLEPRFKEARDQLGAESCASCHREHKGVRVTMAPTSCATCHQDLALKNDPLDVSHRELIAKAQWTTCLGCHDYHGNHKRQTQQKLEDAYAAKAITDYLAGGPSPYGNDLKFPTQWGAR
ncbi:cytochrome c3 family protein [Bradyrhizobium jicamae]|uniref:cytochrome c3 family protein n=1 Tax=Bradyrhizobium jicamae TaxID=280332 RepID=UPI001BA4728B|nr:cytochrome c3 family protein [Bradyrhizobium jicamae]MBR0757616.1 cytochrome c3 family protein [Bradyrhizobium jicamae]